MSLRNAGAPDHEVSVGIIISTNDGKPGQSPL
jgi:hypothetical protein